MPTLSTAKTVALLRSYDTAYAKGKPLVKDSVYDKMRDAFAKANPNHSYLKQVGAPVKGTKAIKSRMPITVGSLDKVRPADALAFMNSIEKKQPQQNWYLVPKFDGASGLLRYVDNKRDTVWTRGDGETGRVITSAASHVQGVRASLPAISEFDYDEILIRGEFVMHKSIFEQYYAKKIVTSANDNTKGAFKTPRSLPEGYKHPRNLVVGLLNRIDIANSIQDLKRITFIAFYIYVKDSKGKWIRPASRHKELILLQMMGFTTITNPSRYTKGHFAIVKKVNEGHKNLRSVLPILDTTKSIGSLVVHETKPTAEQLISILTRFKKEIDIHMDGLVIEPGSSGVFIKAGEHLESHPSYIRAVKLDAIDQEFAVGTIDHIDWDISKRGLLKPVVVLKDSISFDGVDVTNITGNNAAFVKNWGFGIVGAKVRVTRSGDVIPKIISRLVGKEWIPITKEKSGLRFDYKLPTKCPSCKTALEWNDTNVDIVCPNDACPGRKAKSISSFFTTLDADQLASGTVKQLIDAGYNSVPKILALTEVQATRIPGFQKTKAKNIVASLGKVLNDQPLAKVMHASGIFATTVTGLGSTKLAAAVGHLQAKLGKDWLSKNDTTIRKAMSDLGGFAKTSIDLFVNSLPEWRKFYTSIAKYHSLATGTKASSMVAAFTGFRDNAAEAAIEKNGGRIAGVSRNSTVLFAASMGSTKAQKAAALGVKIVAQKDMQSYLASMGVKI